MLCTTLVLRAGGTCAVVAGRGEVVPRVAELDVPDGEDVAAVAHDARPREQRPQPDGAVLGTAQEESAV